jgi:hypothetical protein
VNIVFFAWLVLAGGWGTIDVSWRLARYAIRHWTVKCEHAHLQPADIPAAALPKDQEPGATSITMIVHPCGCIHSFTHTGQEPCGHHKPAVDQARDWKLWSRQLRKTDG